LLFVTDLFAWWQDERKKTNLTGDHHLMRFAKEFSRRTSSPVRTVLQAVPHEISKLLREPKQTGQMLNQRVFKSIIAVSADTAYVFTGSAYQQVKAAIRLTSGAEDSDCVDGMCACPGYWKGIARIITNPQQQANEFHKGDILITSMTRPEHVPLMKLISAIVTNEGGLTCHAAIISRELAIPCVIATKHATNVFSSGNTIEVDAGKGVVKKLKEG